MRASELMKLASLPPVCLCGAFATVDDATHRVGGILYCDDCIKTYYDDHGLGSGHRAAPLGLVRIRDGR